MGKLDTSWIKWGNTSPTCFFLQDIDRLRQLINNELTEMSLGSRVGIVNLFDTDRPNTMFSDDIVKQCAKELRKKGFWADIDNDLLFIYRGFRMMLFNK